MSSCRKKFPYIDVMNLQIRMAYNKKIETENPFLKGDAKKHEDNTSSSSRNSPEWKDICHTARLR